MINVELQSDFIADRIPVEVPVLFPGLQIQVDTTIYEVIRVRVTWPPTGTRSRPEPVLVAFCEVYGS